MFEKHPSKNDILSKDAVRWSASLIKNEIFPQRILLVKTNYLVSS